MKDLIKERLKEPRYNPRAERVYISDAYMGLMIGQPTFEMTKLEIAHMKKVATTFCSIEPYVHLNGLNIEQKRLPRIMYAGWFSYGEVIPKDNGCGCGSHACIIWFGDSRTTLEDSIKKMLSEINWEEVAENFDY